MGKKGLTKAKGHVSKEVPENRDGGVGAGEGPRELAAARCPAAPSFSPRGFGWANEEKARLSS